MSHEPPRGGQKRLTKSHDRKLGGVAGGLAEYFDVDPTLVRVIFVVALFLPGLGLGALVAYILMWMIIPDAEGSAPPRPASEGGGPDATMILGVIILVLGVILLLRSSWVWTTWFGWAGGQLIWPAILIGIGAYVIYSARGRA